MSNENPVVDIRAKLRGDIFKTKPLKSKKVDFFGTEIELRQPSLGAIINAQDNENRQSAVIEALIQYAFVPDTDIKLFEDGDAESFKSMPFGADFLRISNALGELTEVNFLDGKQDS